MMSYDKQFNAILQLLNYFSACGIFCCLLIPFANSLNPDQAQQNVGPDLDTLIVLMKEFFE